jgi:hypothetical protein
MRDCCPGSQHPSIFRSGRNTKAPEESIASTVQQVQPTWTDIVDEISYIQFVSGSMLAVMQNILGALDHLRCTALAQNDAAL